MFEQEIQMEEQEGRGIGPFFIIVAMVVILVGGIGYMVIESNRMLKPEEASPVLAKALQERPQAAFKFHSGHVEASVFDSASSPQYKLLQNAGIIDMKLDKKTGASDIKITAAGEEALKTIPELKKKDEGDGSILYSVPLADRKFLKVEKIEKLSAKRFNVTYSWQWAPNKFGDIFDADGQYVKKFNTWDRTMLIDKHGADFYHGTPTTETITLVKGGDGWEISRE